MVARPAKNSSQIACKSNTLNNMNPVFPSDKKIDEMVMIKVLDHNQPDAEHLNT